ncbi:unnamed protein product [Rotaria magnacalcarata]
MLTLWQSFLIWIVFLFLMQSTDGLRCYSCSNCNDPFNSNGVQITEGSNDMYCMVKNETIIGGDQKPPTVLHLAQ